ncbi:MAG: ComF family protein [Rhabdaerophilum sp.]
MPLVSFLQGAACRGGQIGRLAARRVADFILPPQCVLCQAATADPGGLCAACWREMAFIHDPVCQRLGTPFAVDFGAEMLSPAAMAEPPAFDRGRAALRHAGAARKLVSRLKYGERLDLAPLMARLMVAAGRPILADATVLVPVPLHRGRLWRRRYNQAALLAREISRLTGLPVVDDALVRRRSTPPQVGLRRPERQANMAGAFAIGPDGAQRLAGHRVVVIDDVRTTGATLNACAHILRKAGARRIDVLTFSLVTGSEALP